MTASSNYFTAALGPNFQEGSQNEFVLDDTDGETVKAIVVFCYTGHINLTEENVGNFLAIASSVELGLLEKKCVQFYNDKLSVTNAIATSMIADKYSAAELRQRAFGLICDSFEMVPTTDIQQLDYRLLCELLKRNELKATEALVFERLVEWFQSNEAEHKPHMPALLKLIRLEHIPPQVGLFTLSLGNTILSRQNINFICRF